MPARKKPDALTVLVDGVVFDGKGGFLAKGDTFAAEDAESLKAKGYAK